MIEDVGDVWRGGGGRGARDDFLEREEEGRVYIPLLLLLLQPTAPKKGTSICPNGPSMHPTPLQSNIKRYGNTKDVCCWSIHSARRS